MSIFNYFLFENVFRFFLLGQGGMEEYLTNSSLFERFNQDSVSDGKSTIKADEDERTELDYCGGKS